ncbi:MAG: hypothetical protein HOV67_13785 [Kribbellaceae bacterium]|nr:hypothetical protein [Kribbellaceae bacterium]
MSRYLEDAARVLRKAEELAGSVEHRIGIANAFAALAAIEKGLLPASLVEVVVEAILARHTP